MSWVHIHLMLNHIPVLGTGLGLVILTVASFWKSKDLERFALYYFVSLGLLSLLVYFPGEPAEESLEQVAGISKAVIERHEDASVYALIGIELVAVLALAGLYPRRWALRER